MARTAPNIMKKGKARGRAKSASGRQTRRGAAEFEAKRFRSLFDSAPCGILVVDRRGRIALVNHEAQRLFGSAERELDGQAIERLIPEFFHPHDPRLSGAFTAALVARAMGAGRELFARRKDGQEFAVEIGLSPLDTEEGPAVLAIVVDISERKRAEAKRHLLVRRIVGLQEAERRDLARELHDEIGQLLTSLKIMLEERGESRRIEEMVLLVKEILARVRDVSMNLRPPMLDDLGLLKTLEWLCKRYTSRTGIAVRFAHEGLSRRFGEDIEIGAFRIAQEALTNVARHASVREVQLDVRASISELEIRVTDRGAGFAKAATDPAASGFRGMTERTRLLHGRFSVMSSPGEGVAVIATLPLAEPPGGDR